MISFFLGKTEGTLIKHKTHAAKFARKHGVLSAMINGWKRQAAANSAQSYGAKPAASLIFAKKEVAKLHAKIGQLVVERGFSAGSSHLILRTKGKKR
ncbi:MAG: hypothetical protein U5N55_01905 [Cypionkella sp.]|nr:hypothetical protein [Cypionkella sp.]